MACLLWIIPHIVPPPPPSPLRASPTCLGTRVRSPSAPILPHTEKRNEGVDPQPSPHRSLPTHPPTAASPCPPYRHARRRGWRRRARLPRDGPPPTSQAECSRLPPENAHACVRCRTTPADTAADVAPSTRRTDLGAASLGQRADTRSRGCRSRKPSLGTW